MKPDAYETAARRKATQDVRQAVSEILPHNELETFGSEQTGLATAVSDLDFRLCPSTDDTASDSSGKTPPRFAVRKKLITDLRHLHRALDKHPKFMLAFLRHSRYPLISVVHKQSGIDVQIVCANDTSAQRDLMKTYLNEYPGLKQTYLLVKTMLEVRGLSDVYRGGLGSYGIFIMIVASFKLIEQQGFSMHKKGNPAQLFLNFLHYWSYFDTYTHGVRLEPPGIFEKLKPDATENHHDFKTDSVAAQRTDPPVSMDDSFIGMPTTTIALAEDTEGGITDGSLEQRVSDSSGFSDDNAVLEQDALANLSEPTEQEWLNEAAEPSTNHKGFKIGATNPLEPYLLSLIDPADATNDLGRKASGIKHIIATISAQYYWLDTHMWDFDLYAEFGDRMKLSHTANALESRMAKGQLTPWWNRDITDGRFDKDEAAAVPPQFVKKTMAPFLMHMVGPCHLIHKERRDKMREFAEQEYPALKTWKQATTLPPEEDESSIRNEDSHVPTTASFIPLGTNAEDTSAASPSEDAQSRNPAEIDHGRITKDGTAPLARRQGFQLGRRTSTPVRGVRARGHKESDCKYCGRDFDSPVAFYEHMRFSPTCHAAWRWNKFHRIEAGRSN